MEKRKIKDIILYDKNPRVNKDAVDHVLESLKRHGQVKPIVLSAAGHPFKEEVVCCGHTTLKALKKFGSKEALVIVKQFESEAEFVDYNIRDNKVSEFAEWDEQLLADLSAEFDIDLAEMGFDDFDIEGNEGLTDEDEVPEVPEEPTAKLGQIWKLGEHRLMCGDSSEEDQVNKLLSDESPNTMITDPPYGVEYEANWRAEAKGRKKTEREESSSLMNDNQADWGYAYSLFKGDVAYVWHASAFTDVVMKGLRDAGFEIKQQIIWNKNVHALSRSDYHWKHEPCWYAVKKGGDRNWNGGRSQMTVWDIKSVIFEEGKTAHPTQKPVEIYTRAIEHHTNKGEYIYEPFGGSGTSIIAAEKLNRRSLTMELDPKYCEVIIKRWEDFTGKKAELIDA